MTTDKPRNANMMLPVVTDVYALFSLLAKYGGRIISSNDLKPEMIVQARASNRIYIDESSLGYIWEPPFADRFPVTEEEVLLFDMCYPIEVKLPAHLTFENLMKDAKKHERTT